MLKMRVEETQRHKHKGVLGDVKLLLMELNGTTTPRVGLGLWFLLTALPPASCVQTRCRPPW